MASSADSDAHHGFELREEALSQDPPTDIGKSATEMRILDIRSDGPLPQLPVPPGGVAASLPTSTPAHLSSHDSGGTFWFEGDVLMCGCPDCGAPMTVRIWLMIADCWLCGTSIELTEEQEDEVRRLVQRREAQRQPATVGAGSLRGPVAAAAGTQVAAPRAPVSRRRPRPEPPPPPSEPPSTQCAPARQRQVARRPAGVTAWINTIFKDMPAWLVSLIFHIILLTILGLITDSEEEGQFITLSTRVSTKVREGGDTRIVDPTDASQYDLGVPDVINLDNPAHRRAMVRADQAARDLRLVDTANPHLPDLDRVRKQIGKAGSRSGLLATRDPRLRVDMVRQEGGTTLTEAAVARGLKWLATHQNSNGSWSLDDFESVHRCRCGAEGNLNSESAGTSLALLPFLGAGQTHLLGIYKNEVAQGLRWLLDLQEENGDLRGSTGQYPGMYAHGQATIVLCEAFLMTGDEQLRIPAQKAIDYIVNAQYPDGGWRYYPKRDRRWIQGDLSVTGWQLMALQSALAANLSVPEETLELAGQFLDRVQHRDGALYAYLPNDGPSHPMTAEGLLSRIYLGWKRSHPSLVEGVDWMLKNHPPDDDEPDIYYWYYATQTMHHFGGAQWERWNLRMRDVLVATQETSGHRAGSWTPDGPLVNRGGRIYMTAMAICCLEVYYRHLPLFRQLEL